jgi:hypothetical protein
MNTKDLEVVVLDMDLNLGEFVISESIVENTMLENYIRFEYFRKNGHYSYNVINLINNKKISLYVQKNLYYQDTEKYHKILYKEYCDALNKLKRDIQNEILTYEKMDYLKGNAKVFKKINRKQKLDVVISKLNE